MLRDRPNKTPRPHTIARHYSEGKYCDYPADILMAAINTTDHHYNPTAIPIRLGFQQFFAANFDAFVYLSNHRNPNEIQNFLDNPDGFMTEAGIKLGIPFDQYAPKIFAALVEDDILAAFKDTDTMAVCHLMHSDDKASWRFRHPERYPKNYMIRNCYWRLEDLQTNLYSKTFKEYGFNEDLTVDLLFVIHHFYEK